MAQVTGKKVATTPMPTPTGTSGAIIDSFNTQDDQTVNAPSIHIVKDALTTINDKLNKHTIGTVQNISTVVNTTFTAPSDGYIFASISYQADQYLYITDEHSNVIIQLSTTHSGTSGNAGMNGYSVYVRKGFTIIVNASRVVTNGELKLKFYPLA